MPVTTEHCQDCGGVLGEVRRETVSVIDLPAQPQPEVRHYAVEVRPCQRCGRKVRGQHPGLARDQQGATAHRVGPRVKALAHLLHYGHGVPVRKTSGIIEDLTGIRLSQGAISQDAMKQTDRSLGRRYAALRDSVRQQTAVHTDDTGWRVKGEPAFLMAFVNPALSVYQIRPRHRNEEVRELIPADYKGVLICDRGKSYDAEELTEVKQQKCLAHQIRNAVEVEKGKTGPAAVFSRKPGQLLQAALKLRAEQNRLPAGEYNAGVEDIEGQLRHHLRNRILRDDDNQRLLNGIGTQSDRGHLLRFLRQSGVEPPNNRAERDLRPAVIARKVSHCSRNQNGARAFEAFTSVLQTLRKTNAADTVSAFIHLLADPSVASAPS